MFSFTFPATHLALRGLSPVVVGAGRSVVAAAAGGACLWIGRAELPARRDWPGLLCVAGGVGIGFGVLSALALPTVGVAASGVVTGLLPITTAVIASVRSGERPSPVFWAASLTGAGLVFGYLVVRVNGRLTIADLLLLAALAVAAIGYVEGGRLSRHMPGWQVICWALLFALPVSVPITVVAMLRTQLHPGVVSLSGFAYVSLMSMLLGFFAWNRGLATAGIARASQVQLAQPLLTLGWAALLLGERVGIGTFFVAVGVLNCVGITQRVRISEPAPRSITIGAAASSPRGLETPHGPAATP